MADELGTPTPDTTGAAAPAGTPPEGTPAATPPVEGVPATPPDDKAGLNAVPEKYESFTLPEGYTLDEARNTEFGEFAKVNGWTQDQAQQAVDLYMKMQQQNEATVAESITARKTEWETTIKNDDEIGGADFDKKTATALKAIEKFGTPELKAVLEETGLGSHPELVRFAYRAGLNLPEDTQPEGTPGAAPEGSKANLLYPSTSK